MKTVCGDTGALQPAGQLSREANICVLRHVVQINGKVGVCGVEPVQIKGSEPVEFGSDNYDATWR